MPRSPLQVLVLPYRMVCSYGIEYAIFRRSDNGDWQGIAGGAENAETAIEAARREAKEEAGLPSDSKMLLLDCCCSIPVIHFADRALWELDRYVVPEHCFGILVSAEIRLSAEQHEVRWVSYDEALRLLRFDSNKTALWELNERLMRSLSSDA